MSFFVVVDLTSSWTKNGCYWKFRKTYSNKKSKGHATKHKYRLKNLAKARLKTLSSKYKDSPDSPEVDDVHTLFADINTQVASNGIMNRIALLQMAMHLFLYQISTLLHLDLEKVQVGVLMSHLSLQQQRISLTTDT